MNILFYISSIYPYGVAWSSRGRHLAKLMRLNNYDVHIITRTTLETNYTKGDLNYFDGISYEALSNRIQRFSRFYRPLIDLHEIKKYINQNNVDIVISSTEPHIYKPLKRFLDKKNIPLYIEQCEWFDISNFKLFGKYDPYYRALMKRINYDYSSSAGIIAISKYLETHYLKQGSNVIRIPTILDTASIEYRTESITTKKSNKSLKLVFAGSIGAKKELLKPIIKAIDFLKGDLNIEFSIYGPSRREVLQNLDEDYDLLDRLEDSVFIHGRIGQEEVYEKLRGADFMIFIRPNRQSSDAGFPTKFVESLVVGTPVITNNTSDIKLYLINEVNGYLIKDDKCETLVNIFKTAANLNQYETNKMRNAARETAVREFDYKKYKNQFYEFINRVNIKKLGEK